MVAPPDRPLRKGDESADVKTLYEYLRHLGYAPRTPQKAGHALEAVIRYDDGLAESVRHYQQVYGLDPDGELNEATLDDMRQPRCGVPDFLLPGVREAPIGSSAVPVIRAWPRTDLTYDIIRFTGDLAQSQVSAAISQAFETWAAVTPLTFRRRRPGQPLLTTLTGLNLAGGFPAVWRSAMRTVARLHPADILIGFFVQDHGDPNPFGRTASIVGHGYFPPGGFNNAFSGDVHFNDAVQWKLQAGINVDLVAAAIHEIGHALGLDEAPNNPEAVMFPKTQGRRQLAPADIEAIQSLYGPGS